MRRVGGEDHDANLRPMRTVISALRRRLDDDSKSPTYIFTEPRVGYLKMKTDDDEETG